MDRAPRLIAIVGCAVAALTATACGSDGGSGSSGPSSCVSRAPLKAGVTPSGTDLCLGTAATVRVTSDTKVPATITVAVTAIQQAPAADLAEIAKQIPKYVTTSGNDMYYLRETATMSATAHPNAFKGDDPLLIAMALQPDKGDPESYAGIETDSCSFSGFGSGTVGDSYRHCDVIFVDKGAKPVSATFTTLAGPGSSADRVRWSTRRS